MCQVGTRGDPWVPTVCSQGVHEGHQGVLGCSQYTLGSLGVPGGTIGVLGGILSGTPQALESYPVGGTQEVLKEVSGGTRGYSVVLKDTDGTQVGPSPPARWSVRLGVALLADMGTRP